MAEVNASRDFKGIWIPREIWLNQTLSIQAKVLWAEIHSLYDREKGGCFASNEYLSAFLGLKLSRMREVLKELTDIGLVETISFNGRTRVLKAKTPEEENTGNQTAGKPALSVPEKHHPDCRKTGTPSYIESKEEKKDIKNIYTAFGAYVKLTQETYDALCAKHGKELTDSIIEDINNYCPNHLPNGYENYHAAFNTFFKKQQKDGKPNLQKKSFKEILSKNFKNKELNSGYYISFDDENLEIQSSTGYSLLKLKFRDSGFYDQLDNFCRNKNIPFKKE